MHGATIAETESSFVLVLDKQSFSKDTIDHLRERFTPETPEVGFVDDDEQAEIEQLLTGLSEADRQIVFSERIRFDD